jgi:PKD repeat protein
MVDPFCGPSRPVGGLWMPEYPFLMIDRLTARRLLSLCLLSAILLVGGCFQPNGFPVAAFTLFPETGESPLVVTFDASASYDPDGAIVRYDWEFGDGSAGTGRSPAHTYAVDSETMFAVRLTVTDNDGNQASGTQTITVCRAPPPPEAARVEFVWPFHYDADGDDAANLNDEYFTLENTGTEPVDLGGWTVSNERGAVFRFPDGYRLTVGAVVFVHSGTGIDSGNILFWGAVAPVWKDDSDIAVLCDAAGLIIDIYRYVSC